MLTGTLLFTASDPIEWVYCHIARQPLTPADRLEGVPVPVSALIMKLLTKTAEDRYQTAAGVESDLRRCLAAWQAGRTVQVLKVAHIIVLGHARCGGIRAYAEHGPPLSPGDSIHKWMSMIAPAAADAEKVNSASTQIGDQMGRELLTAYLAALKAKTDVKINQANLEKKAN